MLSLVDRYAVHTGAANDNALKATPEVFEGGKFIMPGIKTPEHAVETLKELVDIVTPFLITDKGQCRDSTATN